MYEFHFSANLCARLKVCIISDLKTSEKSIGGGHSVSFKKNFRISPNIPKRYF